MKIVIVALLWLAAAAAQAQGAAAGSVVAIGGALLDSNAAVWKKLVQLAGADPCFSIIATASGSPEASAAAIAANFARHGAKGEVIAVAPNDAAAARDAARIDRLQRCRGVFFAGGDQQRLLDTLLPGGQATPLLDAVRAVLQRGGVVAGTSAGAAVLSAIAFRDAPEPLAVMKGRLQAGREWGRGFALLPAGVIADQHFIRRGRIARLLPLMQATNTPWGLGVEEDSAAIVRGSEVEVVGAHGVLVADLRQATRNAALPMFNLRGAVLHWLQDGDRFDLATATFTPALFRTRASVLEPLAPGFKGWHRGAAFVADILAEGLLPKAMARLVDSDQRELRALSFGSANDPAPELGFEWRFWCDAATRGWLTTQPDAYSLTGVRLDIVPVRMSRPLYEPIQP